MKILLTGATGYIGKRLLPVLLNKNHTVVCAVRDKSRFIMPGGCESQIELIELDMLKPETFSSIPNNIDAAYYLIHSMATSIKDFDKLEAVSAKNFKEAMEKTQIKHLIYLGGISNQKKLSRHLASRKAVEKILSAGRYNFTALRAGIIVGSGSASFEIIRDLVEKLPVIMAPKWVLTKSHPVAIRDVIQYLSRSLFNEYTYNKGFDIGGPDVLTYKDMLLKYAEARSLKRWIIIIPIITPRLSSYWLYFVTSTSFRLAISLVDSMKVDVTATPNQLAEVLGIEKTKYKRAIKLAFRKIQQNEIVSSWKDSTISSNFTTNIDDFIQVPEHGCYKNIQKTTVPEKKKIQARVWAIGGDRGWYYADWLWKLRGFIDRMVGGVGLRRGRTNPYYIHPGDALDFWRVILADESKDRLLLYAEMIQPGEAWLEFRFEGNTLYQIATFRPKGVWGRLYWHMLKPAHWFIFKNMLKRIVSPV